MHAAERGELEAFRDFYAAAPPELGADMKPVGGALCLRLEPLSTVTMFNRVLGLGIGEPACEHARHRALAAEAERVGRGDPAPLVPAAREHALEPVERAPVAGARELGSRRPALCVVARRQATHQPALP